MGVPLLISQVNPSLLQVMTNRMLRHMHLINFTTMESDVIESIFTTITKAFLEADLTAELVPMAAPLVRYI